MSGDYGTPAVPEAMRFSAGREGKIRKREEGRGRKVGEALLKLGTRNPMAYSAAGLWWMRLLCRQPTTPFHVLRLDERTLVPPLCVGSAKRREGQAAACPRLLV